jgi:hypothetical protein
VRCRAAVVAFAPMVATGRDPALVPRRATAGSTANCGAPRIPTVTCAATASAVFRDACATLDGPVTTPPTAPAQRVRKDFMEPPATTHAPCVTHRLVRTATKESTATAAAFVLEATGDRDATKYAPAGYPTLAAATAFAACRMGCAAATHQTPRGTTTAPHATVASPRTTPSTAT